MTTLMHMPNNERQREATSKKKKEGKSPRYAEWKEEVKETIKMPGDMWGDKNTFCVSVVNSHASNKFSSRDIQDVSKNDKPHY
jgi:hypothetical protein